MYLGFSDYFPCTGWCRGKSQSFVCWTVNGTQYFRLTYLPNKSDCLGSACFWDISWFLGQPGICHVAKDDLDRSLTFQWHWNFVQCWTLALHYMELYFQDLPEPLSFWCPFFIGSLRIFTIYFNHIHPFPKYPTSLSTQHCVLFFFYKHPICIAHVFFDACGLLLEESIYWEPYP